MRLNSPGTVLRCPYCNELRHFEGRDRTDVDINAVNGTAFGNVRFVARIENVDVGAGDGAVMSV